MNTDRRDFLYATAALASTVWSTGCFRTPPRARVVVGFIDISASVNDYGPYREAWSKIIERLQPGDRVLLGPISDRTLTNFRPLVDCEIPSYNYWLDVRENYEEALNKTRGLLAEGIAKAEKMHRAAKTDIMNALWLAGQVFAGDPRKPLIVLFSDMIEDSDTADFETIRLDESTTTRLIDQKKRRAELPALRGARVYVVGASSRTAEKALEIERFWIRFVREAGGVLAPENYGPAMLNVNF